MNVKSIAVALFALGYAASSYASVYTYDINARSNITNTTDSSDSDGASPLSGALFVTAGEQFTVSTNPGQLWHAASPGDSNYANLTSNANGTTAPGWTTSLPGIPVVELGSLVADIGGEYAFIGAGTNTFTAWNTGELLFNFTDFNGSGGDNSGTIVSTVTVVPEPAGLALLALGLVGLAIARRRKQ